MKGDALMSYHALLEVVDAGIMHDGPFLSIFF
jgi:hypothetical protein